MCSCRAQMSLECTFCVQKLRRQLLDHCHLNGRVYSRHCGRVLSGDDGIEVTLVYDDGPRKSETVHGAESRIYPILTQVRQNHNNSNGFNVSAIEDERLRERLVKFIHGHRDVLGFKYDRQTGQIVRGSVQSRKRKKRAASCNDDEGECNSVLRMIQNAGRRGVLVHELYCEGHHEMLRTLCDAGLVWITPDGTGVFDAQLVSSSK